MAAKNSDSSKPTGPASHRFIEGYQPFIKGYQPVGGPLTGTPTPPKGGSGIKPPPVPSATPPNKS